MREVLTNSARTRLVAVLLIIVIAGCTRTHYRTIADQDVFCILHEKADYTPWGPPPQYSIYPHWQSRLYDPTPIDDPQLPIPSPQLYAYDLPELPARDALRFQTTQPPPARPAETHTSQRPTAAQVPDEPIRLAAVHADADRLIPLPPTVMLSDDGGAAQEPLVRFAPHDAPIQPARSRHIARGQRGQQAGDEALPAPSDESPQQTAQYGIELRQMPIPASYWAPIPTGCLRRMLEFESVREEYRRTFQREPLAEERDDSPRLALEDIVDLTLLNSRDYQTQKELLYRVALALTLERFDYQLKPSVGDNGTAVDLTHDRSAGETVNTLQIPSNLQLDKVLVTGGDFLARFANSVVLVFNGPSGFAADVGSELLFDVSQSVLQRDVRLESLTQTERDVVYAARDFARFRKTLFVAQSQQYYALIRQYRQIEINSQDYFAFVRQFNQQEAELQAGLRRRIEVDQIEQQMLGRRRQLIGTCTDLERSLDDLNISIGLPTEQRVNVDLTELNMLTLRDELAVSGELIGRVRRRLMTEREAESPSRATLLSRSVVLLERILDSLRIRRQLGQQPPEPGPLLELRRRRQIDQARLNVEEAREELENELRDEIPSLPIVIQRRMDLVNELLRLIGFQLELADQLGLTPERIDELRRQFMELSQHAQRLSGGLERLIAEERLDDLPLLINEAEQLQIDAERLVQALDELVGIGDEQITPEQALQQTIDQVDELLRQSESYLLAAVGGLVPIEIDMDEAMLTALVQRLDLMNERGFVADEWRQIKLAGDDLKSILNLRATQAIRTRADVNRPFGFTFDESTTSLSATFDAPLNRRAQRNSFRVSLIDYQAALRRLTLLEDTIKLSVRNDLRSLALDQEQYVIDVASAALAFERVVSTGLELRLGIGGVIARDFIEAQLAYTSTLSAVASQHIGYILDRTQLFLNLELLDVGDDGFWDQLYREEYQPTPSYQLPSYAQPAYGQLHPRLKYSRRIKRMLYVPTGTSVIHSDPQSDERGNLDENIERLPAPG